MADARKATSNPHSVGVLFAVAGKAGFVLSEVLPAVAYLRTGLGIADAAERRRRNDLRGTSWALSFEVHLQEVMSPVIGFFDVVRSNLTSTAPSGSPTAHRVKAFKIQALCAAPFDVTIFLDLDSRPCRPDFASLLVDALGSADIALTNKYSTQSAVSSTSAVHWAGNESHNSACVVLNMRSPRTRALLQCYAAAFAAAVPLASRDQPSLSLALRSMALPSQLSSTHPSSSAQLTPKVVARLAVAAQKRYGTLRHVDLTSAVFCRKKLSPVVSCSAGCVLVHKPQKHDIGFKVFGVGFKKTGTTTLAAIMRRLDVGASPPDRVRYEAVDALLLRRDATTALDVASRYKAFVDAPWGSSLASSMQPPLYQQIATRYKDAKFVLTVRPEADWWRSIRDWVTCQLKKQSNVDRYTQLLGAHNASRAAWIAAYRRHNDGIISYFAKAPQRLLVIDFFDRETSRSTGWSRLCPFLRAHRNCPTGPLPHENAFVPSHGALASARSTEGNATAAPASGRPKRLDQLLRSFSQRPRRPTPPRRLDEATVGKLSPGAPDFFCGSTKPSVSGGFAIERFVRHRQMFSRCEAPPLTRRSATSYLAIARAGSATLMLALEQEHAHHDHRCTAKDLQRRGARRLFLALRSPASRIFSGIRRRVEGHKSSKTTNTLFRAHFNGTDAANRYLDALRDERNALHAAAMESTFASHAQNFMLPVYDHYLAKAPASLHIIPLCVETLSEDLVRAAASLVPPLERFVEPSAHVPHKSTIKLRPLSEQNRLWIQGTYAADAELHSTACGSYLVQ